MRRPSALSRNHYFVIGLLLGLVLSCYIPQDIWELVQQEECPQEVAENLLIERFGQDFEPHLNLINKPLAAKKPVSPNKSTSISIAFNCSPALALSFSLARNIEMFFCTWSTRQSERGKRREQYPIRVLNRVERVSFFLS